LSDLLLLLLFDVQASIDISWACQNWK